MMQFGKENFEKGTWLFLEHLADGPGNALTIVVSQSENQSPSEEFLDGIKGFADTNEPLYNLLSGCTQIVPDYAHAYEIYFENYIIYQIRNESYCSYDPEEQRVGDGLILFNKSVFLDYLTKSTDVVHTGNNDSFHPGKFQHYGVYTSNHIIDIISHCEPVVKKINLERENPLPLQGG